ncbi:extracellular solute-binding protein [Tropicimonas sp.]|uniref:extracellular solute-binding protein n=1 Tax=Tropicimonas sp. TaxID=2067044 RepID=UPI003A873A3C
MTDPISALLRRMRPVLAGVLIAAVAGQAQAAPDDIVTSYGFSTYAESGMKYPEGFAHLDYVNPDAPKGGEISVWAQGTFDSMNPFTRKGRAGNLSSIPYERLLSDVADDAYGAYCLLCETLEYPESQDWVIFTLRPEARFADGTPVTAGDVVFTVDLFLEQGLPSFAQAVKQLYEKVEALDERRVKFTFRQGVPRKGLISQAGATIVFPKHWFDETGARLDESRMEIPPGSGPYQLDSYDVNRRITYARNPDYWGWDLPINRGRFNFDRIRVEYFADANAAMEAFKAGVYTFREETSSLQWATAYEFPAAEKGWVRVTTLPDGNIPASTGFVFNLRRDKFADPRLREALSLMYNSEWTNETLQYGLFEQRSSYWENSDLAAQGIPEGAELALLQSLGDAIAPEILTGPAVLAHESGSRQMDRGNLRRASELLEQAGWIVGDDGMLRKDGKTLDIEFLAYNPSFDRIIQPYVSNLQRLGVNAVYNRVDPAQYTNLERDHQFDMVYDGYQNGPEEALGISQRFGSEDAEYSLFNPAGYSSEAVDTLIERLIDARTLDEMKIAIRAIDRVLRQARLMVPTWYKANYWIAYWDMFGHPETLPPYSLGQLDFWWYDAEKAGALRAAGALR